ncbi:kinesin-related protein 4-like [Vanessa tameamea]|uniref:Kinesin-related protein 4-like n=1 Tax=Vanessa tameamea TaxID=334116 RepID=A0ABM4AXJ4_VANTA
MSSPKNTEIVSDKDDGEAMASIQLIVKDTIKSIDLEENANTNVVNDEGLSRGSVEDDENSSSIDKNVEEMLLADANQNPDSDNVDDEMELRWDDDDLDDVDEIKNEETLLEENSLDCPKPYTLSLQEEVIKTIEAEEKLLNLENDNESKESPPDSITESLFAPKIDHNLNKPDMMLEIPSHELIEFSDDDEDLTNNLEMSPDLESDEEMSNSTEVPVQSTQVDIHAGGEVQKEAEENPLIDKELKETMDYKALENEAKFAADILTKELNAMDSESNIITDTNTDMTEDFLLKEDTMEDDCLLKDDIIQEDCLLEESTVQEEIIDDGNSVNSESDLNKDKDQTKAPLEIQGNSDAKNTANETELQNEDTQSTEEDITDLCEDILLAPSDDSLDAMDCVPDSEIKTSFKSEAIDSTINTKDTNILETDLDTNVIKDKTTSTNEKKSITETDIVSETVEPETDQITSLSNSTNGNKKPDTGLTDTVPSIEDSKEEEKSILDEKTDLEEKNKIEDENTEVVTHTEDIKQITKDEVPNLLQSTISTNEGPFTSEPNLDLQGDKPELLKSKTSEKIIEDAQIEVIPAHTMDVNEPQPSTSFACSETSKGTTEQSSMFGSSMVQDTSKDVPEMTDSLGLLAESCRMMEEDEEQEYDDDGDGEDEDDFDQDDESSNQMTAEHSEDSNAQHSESEVQKDLQTEFTTADMISEVEKTDNMAIDDVRLFYLNMVSKRSLF